jgi:hypothetical protein
MASIFISGKSIISSEKMLHRDYDRKSSVEKEKKKMVVSLEGLGAKMN